MSKVEDSYFKTLLVKKRVATRAGFFKIPHNTSRDDVRLKLGRYKIDPNSFRNDEPECLDPKSELTLDQEEFEALIAFLRDRYEPFRQGVKAFIPLDQPFAHDNAAQIKALFALPERANLVRFIVENQIIPEELADGLRQAKRAKAVREFERMLGEDLVEQRWQAWFQQNDWVLGSEFVRILDERSIDTQNISDFLMQAYDGFLDIVEIKRPGGGLRFWSGALDHGNPVPSTDLIKAITQGTRYIFEVEQETNSAKFQRRVDGVRTVKPRCILIFGRSADWTDDECEAYRILNAGFHNLTVMTYDHVLARAQRILNLAAD
ncbi:MAG: Shedu anti-phage system protein SduA domain-containing protein [Ramlibacter sp.]